MSGVAEREKVADWRLRELISVYCRVKAPVSIEDIEQLTMIALAESDLHDVCEAIQKGCSLEHAVTIFT